MKPEIVLIQPTTSLTGAFVRLMPLGLLYLAAPLVKHGYSVHIYDCRLDASHWKQDLPKLINAETMLVGFSVMSGYSIIESIKIARFVRSRWPQVSIVWGGPHPTFNPQEVWQESAIDYVISGYGIEALFELAQQLEKGRRTEFPPTIRGLSWRNDQGRIDQNAMGAHFEFINYKEIPYDLVNVADYVFLDTNERVFPLYSAMGCPYQCMFCSSPARYRDIQKKWVPYPPLEVVDHIQYVVRKYNASLIYFIDDDSFVDVRHVEEIIDGVRARGLSVKLGFRGVRVNEILAMSDSFLKKLAAAGTPTIHIGAESGSDRILALMKKGITRAQILEANRKLAEHPEITVFYNFVVGFPSETIEETLMTRDLILQLLRDNPACLIIPLNKPRPLPGTELYELAMQHGHRSPETLAEWGSYDVESADYNPVWLSRQHNQLLRMMFLMMYLIDRKIRKFPKRKTLIYVFVQSLAFLYVPIARLRFRTGFSHFLFENFLYRVFSRIMQLK
jgi:radical SAM superfamily enzyme YgiQ (UPF0313 family)